MGLIATHLGQPETILKTGGVAWGNLTGTEQVSVVIPIAYEEAAVKQEAAGIVINLSVAVTGGTTDGNLTINIYASADNSTKDEVAIVTNTNLAYSTNPSLYTFTYRMDEVGPAIIVGLKRDTGDRTLAPTLKAYRWYYKQVIG